MDCILIVFKVACVLKAVPCGMPVLTSTLSALTGGLSWPEMYAYPSLCAQRFQPLGCCRVMLDKLTRKEQPPSSLDIKLLTKVSTSIHTWRHISDTGAAVKQVAKLPAPAGASPRTQVWQQTAVAAAASLQEDGEVAADMADIADATSGLQHIDTADEDLLQGLLAEDGPGTGASEVAALKVAALAARSVRMAEQRSEDATAAVVERVSVMYDEGLEQDYGDEGYLELSEVSEVSDVVPGDVTAATDILGVSSASSVRAVMARYSLYRLVLRSPGIEAHLHVKVFMNYPLCPPVFSVTKLLDTKSKSTGPVALQAVNEVLALEQQVGGYCISST